MSSSRPAALEGRRVLVVGASAGIGAAFARSVIEEGGQVAVAARRGDVLTDLVTTAGAGHVIPADATIREDAVRVANTAAEMMGGIDLMVYAAGVGVLQRIEDVDPELWIRLFRVNVIGAVLMTGACLRHLGPDAVCAYLASRTVGDANAYFAPYSVTKAALDQSIRAWRVEHPDRRFVRVVMGNCQPTEFGLHMGDELLGPALEAWGAQALPGGLMHVDDVGAWLARSFATMLDSPTIDAHDLFLDARPDPS